MSLFPVRAPLLIRPRNGTAAPRPHSRPLRPRRKLQSGQAAVETALILPLQLFTLLGAIQLSMAYQARLVNEYAAYKTARAASLYRLECRRMTNAALVALVPTVSGHYPPGTYTEPEARYLALTRAVISAGNRPPNNPPGAATPLTVVDYRLTDFRPEFDTQLDPGERPMKVHVRLAYFFEYRVPFANWIMSRFWLQTENGVQLASGIDPIMAVRDQRNEPLTPFLDTSLTRIAQSAIANRYFTVPIVSTFSLRMMSDPLPGVPLQGRCL
ncbi:MAG: pilus assembly protein [Myxococcaceae bacterium]|nr:pilus assembly protein [Myxococcaceae bacterium]